METMTEYAELIANRENLYRFLGRIYRIEADQALFDRMNEMRFPVGCDDEELDHGYRMLEEYFKHHGEDPLTDLAVDYAKVFLGAGIYESHLAAYPYESVYTSPKRLIMQDARDQVLALYRAKGLNKAEMLNVPEDHIALELEFMAHLCRESAAAYRAQNPAALAAGLKEQLDFLDRHLLNWSGAFCADIEKFAETEFYKAAGKITRGFLHLERAMLEDLIAETSREVASAGFTVQEE